MGETRSLTWRLVSRLMALQAAMLAAVLLLIVIALWASGLLVSIEPEDEAIDVLRHAVARDGDGQIVLRETPGIARQRALSADFWFVIRDHDGRSLSQGNVPPEYAGIGGALDGVGQARLGWNIGDPPRPTARMKWVDSPIGTVQILIGPGNAVSWRRAAMAASGIFIGVIFPIIALMALATLIVTPFVVRRTLAGLERAAAQAGQIEINRRGTRLPLADVPREIVPLVSAVNDALSRLDDGYERHKRFLIDAAHELRTPIAILQTRLESLALGPKAARVLEDLARLSTLADQMLDLQRVNRHVDQFSTIDIVAICRKAVADLAPLAIAAGYDLSFDSAAERIDMRGDEGAIERAVSNLIQNAIQYGGRKGLIVVRITPPATVSVSDDGPGVPPQHRERVFEPFYRLGGLSRGVGLGLNLVREIVRLHGGSVAIVEGETGGACVTMTFSPMKANT
jgi:signal transduction histidine kinase